MSTEYLIIGNSAGGIGAAEAIRESDRVGRLTIVSDEPYPAYSRPLISEYLVDRRPIEKMLFRPAGFYAENNIETVFGAAVESLDIKSRTARLHGGRDISWTKLLLATGGAPVVPPLKGADRRGVFTFTMLDNARAIDRFLGQYLKRSARAVVIGGGLIGVSVTEALVKRGVKVSIVEMKPNLLSAILDPEASGGVEKKLVESGVKVITNHTVAEINSYSTDTVTGVTLEDGRPIPCELVVVAIGVRPRVELALGAGLNVNRGIVVDRRMETSATDIYACGDAAEAYDFVHGENRLTPIWPNAYLGGRVAGSNMAGVAAEYPGGTSMNSLKYFELGIVSAGVVDPSGPGYEVLTGRQDGDYRKVVLKDGRIVGMIYAGAIDAAGIVFGLMRDGIDVTSFKDALVDSEFGLISLPDQIRRNRLGSPVTSPEEVLARH